MPKKKNTNLKSVINYPDIKSAYDRVLAQKKVYDNNLCGKHILYLYLSTQEQTVSAKKAIFSEEHYLHLTGLDYRSLQYSKRVLGKSVSTNALNFYQRLGNDASLLNDISFVAGATAQQTKMFFDYTQHKLDNLSQLTSIAKKAEFIGKYKGKQAFDIIVNRANCAIAFKTEQSNPDLYIPISSLNGTAQNLATDIHPVLAIMIKEKEERNYHLQYLNKNITIDKAMFSSELLDTLSYSSFKNENVLFNQQQLDNLTHSFDVSVHKQMKERISYLSDLRDKIYMSEDNLNSYMSEYKAFVDSLNCSKKCDIAIGILQVQANELKNSVDFSKAEDTQSLINDELQAIEAKRHCIEVADSVGGSGTVPLSSQINKMTISADGTVTAAPATDIKLPSIRKLANKAINGIKSALDKINAQKEKSPRSSAKPATEKKNVSHNETTFSAAAPQYPEQRPGQQTPPKQAEQAVQKTAEPKTVHSGYTIMNRAQRAAKMIEARKKADAAQQLDNKSAPKKDNQSR